MLIGPPIPEIQLFKKLTLKIQGQGPGWGQSSNSQWESTILLTHIPFVPCQSALSFLRYSIFQNLTLKIHGQGHSSRSQTRYISFVPCRSALPFLGYGYFKIWHWKFKVMVMGEVKVESHNMGPTFSWLASLSLHVNWASYSWFTTFQYLTLKIEGQGHGWGHNMGLTSYWLISLSFPVNQPSHSWDASFSKFDLENPGSRWNDHVLRNYRSG